jgi:hypothetical protein
LIRARTSVCASSAPANVRGLTVNLLLVKAGSGHELRTGGEYRRSLLRENDVAGKLR